MDKFESSNPLFPIQWFGYVLIGSGILFALGTLLLIASAPVIQVDMGWGFRGFTLFLVPPTFAFGFLILRRDLHQLIGWLIVLFGFVGSLQGFLTEYVVHALFVAPGTFPGGIFAAWVLNWMWIPITMTLQFLLLYFPDGRLLTHRWRLVAWYLVVVLVIFTTSYMFRPVPMDSSIGDLPNPYGLSGWGPWLETTLLIGNVGWILGVVLSAISLLIRFRRSRGVERQQIFAALVGSGQNEIVTVLSTLAIAALFVPVRSRIQIEIDKWFNRKKYNAQQVLYDFAQTMRDETDLEKLTGRLMQVVDETMQPRTISVWLKKEE